MCVSNCVETTKQKNYDLILLPAVSMTAQPPGNTPGNTCLLLSLSYLFVQRSLCAEACRHSNEQELNEGKAGCHTDWVLNNWSDPCSGSSGCTEDNTQSRLKLKAVVNSRQIQRKSPNSQVCVFLASYCSFIYTARRLECIWGDCNAALCWICKHVLFKDTWLNLFLQHRLHLERSAKKRLTRS